MPPKKQPVYPFTPEFLDALPDELAERYRALEVFLLAEITSRLKLTGELNEVTVQDIRALRSHGIAIREIKKVVALEVKMSKKQLDDLLDDVVQRNQLYSKNLLSFAEISAPETLVNADTIAAIREQTMGEFTNLTQSMGFLVDGGRTRLTPAAAYQWALDNAALQVESGAVGYGKAIFSATKQLTDSGVCVCFDGKGQLVRGRVVYESGHKDQIDVSVRRAVLTGVSQINRQYTNQLMETLGTDYVEVSAHEGARNIGDGPMNHESWQGKVYHWNKGKQKIDDPDFPDFIEKTGYGTGAGLCGWNCRHTYSPFIPDVMERTFTDKQLEDMKSKNKKFTYNGREYDKYQATQKQREIERAIRRNKRALANALLPEEDRIAFKTRQNLLYEEYERFSKAAGLKPQRERANVYA